MPSSTLYAAAALAVSVSAAFNPSAKTNVVTYWGQGPNQARLVDTCQNQNVDIVNVAFINVFPDQGPGGWPGSNFGNACYGDVYQHNGVDTDLLKTCPNIGPDVAACQQMGVKVFLSIGGGYPTNYYIQNDTSGQYFADFLWNAFGGGSSSDIPRPWGSSVVDGFDFDIESDVPANELQSGYGAMANRLRNHYAADTSKSYYISGSPQCVVPDAHFSNVIQQASFDFLFVQFYNTPQCSARAGINAMNGNGGGNDITFSNWNAVASQNPNVKILLGLPASPAAANSDQNYYLTPKEAESLVNRFSGLSRFGGIMVWETTYSANNVICGSTYINWMKKILLNPSIDTTCSTTTSVTTTTTSKTSTSSTSMSSTTAKTTSTSSTKTSTSTSSTSTSVSTTTSKTSSSSTSTTSTSASASTTTSKTSSSSTTSKTTAKTSTLSSTKAKRHVQEPTTSSTSSCTTTSSSSSSTPTSETTTCTTSSTSSSSSTTSCSTSTPSPAPAYHSPSLIAPVPAPAYTKPSTAPSPAPYAQPSQYAPAPAVPQNSTRPAPPAPYSPSPYTPSPSPAPYTAGAGNVKAAVGGVFALGIAVVMLA